MTEVFTAGHVCPAVYRAKSHDGQYCVVKLGNSPVTVQEILKNLDGYEMLRKIGLNRICPRIYHTEVSQESALIVMEYCGMDFYSALEINDDPEVMFDELVLQLVNIYRSSAREESPARNIEGVLSKILEQYDMHLAMVFDCNRQLQSLLEILPSKIEIDTFRISCFSSWDFTPRNIFLTKDGLKYVDSNANVLGLPIIDLACFAGVVRDVHNLPGGVAGYDTLEKLAVEDVAGILKISQIQALRLFYLGRLLQLFLGARFRVKTDLGLAHKFYDDAVDFLLKITA